MSPQPRVKVTHHDERERSITVKLSAGREIVFIVDGDSYRLYKECKEYVDKGWYNFTLYKLLNSSHNIIVESTRNSRTVEREITMSRAEHKNSPSKEFRFTAIAPATTQNALSYKNRLWFKSAEDAITHCQDLFDNESTKRFELIIVEAVESVKPKPRVEVARESFKD